MSDRLKSMRRILAVQEQTKRIAEWKLAAVEQRKAALEEEQRALAGFIDGGDLVGSLAQVALKQSRRIAEREAVAEDDRTKQAKITQRAQAKHKLAERLTESVEREESAGEERKTLEQMIEAMVARPSSDA